MRRVGRRYRVAFVAAMCLVVAVWGYASWFRYERARQFGGWVSGSEGSPKPWLHDDFVSFLEDYWPRLIPASFVFCFGFAYILGVFERLKRRRDERERIRLLAKWKASSEQIVP